MGKGGNGEGNRSDELARQHLMLIDLASGSSFFVSGQRRSSHFPHLSPRLLCSTGDELWRGRCWERGYPYLLCVEVFAGESFAMSSGLNWNSLGCLQQAGDRNRRRKKTGKVIRRACDGSSTLFELMVV